VEGHPHRQDQVLSLEQLTESFQPIVGQSVTLRPLQRADQDIEHAFVSALSAESRHNRLLGGLRQVTREYIEQLTTVDYSRDMALAATVMMEQREHLIGVARYVLTEGKACEFALVVADAWQGRGIGRRLMVKLIAVARARGLRQMFGDILATNVAMLGLVRSLGFVLGRNPEDATLTRASLQLDG
jgi:acetyltransferase